MSQSVEVQQFAGFLRMLKSRSDRSYEALANRIGISGSSLHRYCTGAKIPADYGTVQRFARECGATQQELHELHRLWVLADATRRTSDPTTTEPVSAPAPEEPPPPRPRLRRPAILAVAAIVLLAAGLISWTASSRRDAPTTVDGPLLLSSACPPVVSLGQHDECVREVQELLAKAGAKLAVDGDFGPGTLRRVTAFQVLAGLQPRGVVDEATKRALYEQKVSMATWPPEQVERRIREVFPEEPDRAVGIARCQSFLDPLHVLTNTNGTRNWGVFQLSDRLLGELGGTPLQAYDPDWNIQTARRAWSRHRDFRDWEHCDQPFRTSSPAPSR
jgi:hypothetical protein